MRSFASKKDTVAHRKLSGKISKVNADDCCMMGVWVLFIKVTCVLQHFTESYTVICNEAFFIRLFFR